MMRKVAIFGATGSIGSSALDVIARHPDRFRVAALTAQTNVDALVDRCARFRPEVAVIADASLLPRLREGLRARGLQTDALGGAQALAEVAGAPLSDTVIAAIVGVAGLLPTLAAARTGKRLLLANKEAIVCAGNLLLDSVRAGGGELLPVDSEHNAIHQCLAGADARCGVNRLILTASGGPFRLREDLHGVTPAQAIAHPNWVMGPKISVDSATLMNKGLEVIEASWLFDMPADRIEVVIHPQSVIHSMVEFGDGSIVAQLGTPDMRTPLAYCLGFPERIESGSSRLDFLALAPLTFEAPDLQRFPCLRLAFAAVCAGTAASATLNAANEMAVQAFLEGQLPFRAIATVVADVLDDLDASNPVSLEDVLAIDAAARDRAAQHIRKYRATSVN